MQAALIGILFTVLIIALVLGYVMFRLSDTPKISDLNRVIDDLNNLGSTVEESILKNKEAIEGNTTSNEELKTLYDDLLVKSNKNANDISVNAASNVALDSAVQNNLDNIETIQDELMNDYVPTAGLADLMDGHAFHGINLSGDASILVHQGTLKFCAAKADESTCSPIVLGSSS